MILTLLFWLVFGAIVGYIARLLMPGRDPMGCLGTAALGAAGSLAGGTLASLIFEDGLVLRPSGFIGSLIGALLILFFIRQMRGPRGPRRRRRA